MAGPRPRLLIIGNGMAATRLLDELLLRDAGRFAITVIGEESAPGYNRILLSPWLAGEKTNEQVITHDQAWYYRHGIRLYTGDPVVLIDHEAKQATTQSGAVYSWDKLVLATGSRAALLRLPGHEQAGVLAFRTLADAEQLHAAAQRGGAAVVIGGGLLGLEAAWGLCRLGMSVTVVHNGDWLMNRQLDREAGELLAASLQARGINVCVSANSEYFTGYGQVTGLMLSGGQHIPCSLVVMALGIVPEVSLAKSMGLDCPRAIAVDAWLRTSLTDVFALGECCQIDEELFGMVAPIYQQAKVLAGLLCGVNDPGYCRETLPTRLKVSGIDVFSAGDLSALEGCRTLAWRDAQAGHYRRLWFRRHQLVAAVMFGEVDDGAAYFELIEQGRPIRNPAELLFSAEAA